MTPALLLAALLAAPGAGAAPAGPAGEAAPPPGAAELADRVEAALSSIDVPTSPGAWRAMGPDAVTLLERVARDAAALPHRRARALEGLAHLGGDRARRTVVDLARDESLPFSPRASALEGAGRLLAPGELQRELDPVAAGARHRAVRAVAAEVLAARAPERACGALRGRVAREAAADRGAFWRALERCRRAGR